MSTRDRLSRLTADLVNAVANPAVPASDAPSTPPPPAASEGGARSPQVETEFPPVVPRPGRRTGPGELLAFRGQVLAAEGEVARLRERLQEYQGALPTRKLDPKAVRPSRWANRHEASFTTSDFVRFKADIEHAGGNVQPILVQPVEGETGVYEIVFGHRRHRACLELGLPVLASISPERLPDLELFAAMERENRERKDLSPWEQGMMYRKALDEQMFPSQRRLAEALGVSHTWVRKALTVAELPDVIVQCFRTPLELQYKHAEEISQALQIDRKGVLRRAEKLRQSARQSASSVVATLIGKQRGASMQTREVRGGERLLGKLSWDERGQAVIRLAPGVLTEENSTAVLEAIRKALALE